MGFTVLYFFCMEEVFRKSSLRKKSKQKLKSIKNISKIQRAEEIELLLSCQLTNKRL